MMRCIAVDDEKHVLDLLVDNIKQVPYLQLVKSCKTAFEAMEILQKEKIDLIVQYLQRNGHMSENYFEQILGGDDAETIDNFIDRNPNEVLVFGPNGKSVRARTHNQKKLVQEAEKKWERK